MRYWTSSIIEGTTVGRCIKGQNHAGFKKTDLFPQSTSQIN
jgi:hypothetical protein